MNQPTDETPESERPSQGPQEPETQRPETETGGQQPAESSPEAETSELPKGSEAEKPESEGLPEEEPLTPELVEEEALRGDFMLRSAVLLLAFLLGCAEIAETETLLHIKTGQYLSQHGWLPPRSDVFSYTAQDRPWVNLSWLFDLVLAGAYWLGGATAVTLLKAVVAAAMIYFVTQCRRPNVSTWWGSVVAGIFLLVAFPQLTALPELVTLLGLSATLWILHRWHGERQAALWWLVPLFVLWANLDGRMFIGLFLLVLYGVGELVGSQLGRPGVSTPSERRQLWTVTALCFVAACVNPFGWNTLLAPIRLYGTEYPILQQYYPAAAGGRLFHFPLYHLDVLRTPRAIAGLLLLGTAGTTLFLNRRRVPMTHVVLFVGFAVLAVTASQHLAAAALVATILATLNAQEWYAANFSQTYSIDPRERLFSNGGRAATVVGLFAVAILAAGGRLNDPNDRQIGLGFQQRLQTTLTGLAADIEGAFDKRPFNFTPRQGDLLIWLGRKVFIDNRAALFGGSGENDLVTLHRRTRQSLRRRRQGVPFSGRDEIWKSAFDRYRVTHVLPRLSQPGADYQSFFDLLGRWEPTRIGSATAVFYRPDAPASDPKLADFLRSRSLDLVADTFREQGEELPLRPDWPRSRSFYEKWLSRAGEGRTIPGQKAGHYWRLLLQMSQNQQPPFGQSAGMIAAVAYQIIRHANRALAEEPNSAATFWMLGDAYTFLSDLEVSVNGGVGGQPAADRRYLQAVSAYGQSLALEPDNASVHHGLFRLYASRNRIELMARALRRYEQLTDFEARSSSDDLQRFQTTIVQQLDQLQREVELRLARVEQQLNSPEADPVAAAQLADQLGCPRRALQILDVHADVTAGRPDAQLMQGRLFLEVGRPEDAMEVLLGLQAVAQQQGIAQWYEQTALAYLARGDYESAIALRQEWRHAMIDRQLRPVMAPFAVFGPTVAWTAYHSQVAQTLLQAISAASAQALLNVGLSHLETGDNQKAEEAFRQLLKSEAAAPYRPLGGFYLVLLTGDPLDFGPPEQSIPIEPNKLFYDEAAPPQDAEKPEASR